MPSRHILANPRVHGFYLSGDVVRLPIDQPPLGYSIARSGASFANETMFSPNVDNLSEYGPFISTDRNGYVCKAYISQHKSIDYRFLRSRKGAI